MLIFEAVKKYKINAQKTPVFLFGRSFGGLLATNMSVEPASKMFSGVATLTPYYRLYMEKLYNLKPII